MADNNIPFLPIEDLTPRFVFSALSQVCDWGLMAYGIPEAHTKTKGAGVTVAVLDTGVDPTHLDLIGNILQTQNCTSSQSPLDVQGHGTHVCGTIVAVDNGIGVIGVAPEAKIISIKVLGDDGTSGYDSIERGIRLATELGVDIISMSLGATVEPPASFHDAIKAAAAQGIIIVAAAGNDSGSVNWPARYKEVIAVGAIGPNGELTSFSSRGPEVAVIAPGLNIYSTYLANNYAVLSGTSQATPYVAGICALLLSWSRATPGVKPVSGYEEMLSRLDDLSDPHGRIGVHGKTGEIGFGIPNFANYQAWK